MPNLNDAKAAITRPIGPLPAWGWVAVVVGGFFAYKLIKSKSGGSTNSTPAVGSALPTDGTNGAIDSLTQSIQDLLSKLSNTGGGGGGGGIVVTSPIDTSGGSSDSGSGSSGGGGSSGGSSSGSSGGGSTTSGTGAVRDAVGNVASAATTTLSKGTGAIANLTPNIPTPSSLAEIAASPITLAATEKRFLALNATANTQLTAPISVASPGTSNNLAQPSLIQDIGGTAAKATGTAISTTEATGALLSPPTLTETAKVPSTTPTIPAQTPVLRNTGTALRNRVR